MTEHRPPEDRIDEIVEAALDVIDAQGLAGLTMEAVVARTSLSKGGVYRYFGNRQALLGEVFQRIAATFEPVGKEEALAWGLPLKETLMALLFSIFEHPDGLRYRRVHLRLMPELPPDDPATHALRERLDGILVVYEDIARAIIKRDGLSTRPGYRKIVRTSITIGQSLFDGLLLNSLAGLPIEELRRRMSAFIDLVIAATVKRYP